MENRFRFVINEMIRGENDEKNMDAYDGCRDDVFCGSVWKK